MTDIHNLCIPYAKTRLAALILSLVMYGCSRTSPASLRTRVKILSGIRTVHHPISTGSREAQSFFDQGLALVYGFNFEAAVVSFKYAAQLDPHSPMPYWGIALASGPNYNSGQPSDASELTAFDAIRTATSKSEGAPDNERAYIHALALGFSGEGDPDLSALANNYAHAMSKVYKSFPDDPDAAVLYAGSLMDVSPWHLWTLDGNPSPNTVELVSV